MNYILRNMYTKAAMGPYVKYEAAVQAAANINLKIGSNDWFVDLYI